MPASQKGLRANPIHWLWPAAAIARELMHIQQERFPVLCYFHRVAYAQIRLVLSIVLKATIM
jgi:hypothetical protein